MYFNNNLAGHGWPAPKTEEGGKVFRITFYAMASKGLRSTNLSTDTKLDAGDELLIPLKPLLAIACVGNWPLYYICLSINLFTTATF